MGHIRPGNMHHLSHLGTKVRILAQKTFLSSACNQDEAACFTSSATNSFPGSCFSRGPKKWILFGEGLGLYCAWSMNSQS
jgi:hypothetical protein